MNTIQFKYVIPQVFASREEQNSDVWQQDITFEKEKVYLSILRHQLPHVVGDKFLEGGVLFWR